jgi:N4-gp56 family major capsid protein
MAANTMSTTARIGKYAGGILKHAVPHEVLARGGRQVTFPKNNSNTYVARRWLPNGTTSATNGNLLIANGTGDRTAALVAAAQTSEGVTPTPDQITPQDQTVVLNQYACLYSFTDQVYDLYEDDIPGAIKEQIGERVALINELMIFGALKASTNQFYGGTGTSRATVNGKLSLNLVRKIVKSLQANHGENVTSVLKGSNNFGSDPVAPGYVVYCHTDLEPDIRDLPGFIDASQYAGQAMPYEVGKVERFRFVTSPDLPSYQDAATSVTASAVGLSSTTGTNPDVYPIIVAAKDAWSQVAVRGLDALKPTYLPPGEKSKSDPFGQRGYAGTIWYKAVFLENNGWLAVANVGASSL